MTTSQSSLSRPPRNGLGYRPHRTTLAGSLGEEAHSSEVAYGTPTLPPHGVCTKCAGPLTVDGADTAVLACLYCGKRFYP